MSKDQQAAMAPCLLTRPKVGRRPATPQLFAGDMMEPQVSVPRANGTSPAATAAPEPLEEPPLHELRLHGLEHGPVKDASGWL